MSKKNASERPEAVIVFVHAPTIKFARDLVDAFSKIAECAEFCDVGAYRFVASSDDTGEGYVPDRIKSA